MKTLYISDLDGTLLQSNKKISDYSIKTINNLIDKGIYFSVATARTVETAAVMVEKININVPIILMNGVIVYDTKEKRNLSVQYIEKEDLEAVITLLKKHNQTGFIYEIINDKLNTYYENLDCMHRNSFYQERVKTYNKLFTKVNDFTDICKDNAVYFSAFEQKEKLLPLYNDLKSIKGLDLVLYKDSYSEELWFLELFSHKASKYNAVKYLRDNYKFDKIVCFGDNLNDLSMFKASDEGYAVENAREELKENATAVIDSNNNDGVAKFLEKRHL